MVRKAFTHFTRLLLFHKLENTFCYRLYTYLKLGQAQFDVKLNSFSNNILIIK